MLEAGAMAEPSPCQIKFIRTTVELELPTLLFFSFTALYVPLHWKGLLCWVCLLNIVAIRNSCCYDGSCQLIFTFKLVHKPTHIWYFTISKLTSCSWVAQNLQQNLPWDPNIWISPRLLLKVSLAFTFIIPIRLSEVTSLGYCWLDHWLDLHTYQTSPPPGKYTKISIHFYLQYIYIYVYVYMQLHISAFNPQSLHKRTEWFFACNQHKMH